MVKPNWRRAAAVVAALTAAQKAQPAKSESIRALLSEWMDPDTGLEGTVATGKKLEAAVANRLSSWFSQAAAVVTAAPISDDLKNDAMEEVEQVVHPKPTAQPYGPPPTAKPGTYAFTADPEETPWEHTQTADGHIMKNTATGETRTIDDAEFRGYYVPIGGRRKKTRRAKKRRTVKRRAKSLRRRRQ
jgi:hypothetical protein